MALRDRAGRGARSVAYAHALALIGVAGATCFLYSALFSPFPLKTHEGLETYMRTHEYLVELGNGHWLPQVFPDAVRGAGSAFPSFYPPASYLIATLLSFLTRDVIRGVNLSLLLSALLSGWAMYFLVVVLTRRQLIAVASALLYISFPYRFVDVFVRGALAESWSFVWFPLILAGTWRALSTRRIPWYLAVSWAGLLLTHVGMALYFLFPYGAFVLLAAWRQGWRLAAGLAGALILAFGLTLWFIAPQQHRLDGVRASDPRTMDAYTDFVVEERVRPEEFVGTWHNGWRGPDRAFILPDGTACPHFYCGMNFVLGTGNVVMFLLLAAWVALLARGPTWRDRLTAAERHRAWVVVGLLSAYAFNLAFMVTPGTFLAVLPSTFGYIQLPWRLMGTVAFFAATITGIVAASRVLSPWVGRVVVGLSLAIVLSVPSLQRSPMLYRGMTERDIVALLPSKSDRGFTVQGEFLPKGVNAYNVAPFLIDEPQVRGKGELVGWQRTDGDLDVEIVARADAMVVFPLMYYDFYRVTAQDGDRLETFAAKGLLAVRVPAGTTAVHVSHGLTLVNRLGIIATLCTALVLVAVSVRRRRHGSELLAKHRAQSASWESGRGPVPAAR